MISELESALQGYPGSLRYIGKHINFYACLRAIPDDFPILAWGGKQSRFACLALAWEERDPNEALSQVITQPPVVRVSGCYNQNCQPFLGGWVGINSYDDYQFDKTATKLAASRVFWVTRVLVFDNQTQQLFEASLEPDTKPGISLDWEQLVPEVKTWAPPSEFDNQIWRWRAESSEQEYLDRAAACLEDIRQGRYYQVNLLRYFQLESEPKHTDWLERWAYYSGPYSSIVRLPDLELYSFSPERFISFCPGQNGIVVRTEPIKGTMPVYQDEEQNRQAREQLASSLKDHAELHMIVDLMRNDLFQLCQPGTVKVLDPGSIHTFTSVHHLIASISGCLKQELTLAEFFTALCPGGSITGAPKIEVMRAIRSYEGRDRGYMMGNFYFWSPFQAYFDSSILIRTSQRIASRPMEFAAGSGLVVRSSPLQELAEIQAKCRVVMNPEKPLGG